MEARLMCIPGHHEGPAVELGPDTELPEGWFAVKATSNGDKWFYDPESSAAINCCADHLPLGFTANLNLAAAVDELHKKLLDSALTKGTEELEVHMTYGELFLYHALLQDYGIDLVGNDRFIPLMERSANRIRNAKPKG